MKTAFTALLLGSLISCSPYQMDFQKEARAFKPNGTPEGPWKGTWRSEVNGHNGPLWCLVSRDPKKPTEWTFRYRAGWGVLQFGDYKHPVTGTFAKGVLPIDGSMELPDDWGVYEVKGRLTPTKFDMRFKSKGDKGTMTLTRPPKPKP